LDQVTLAKRGQILGNDHPDTLASADNLAADQRALGEPGLDRRWKSVSATVRGWWPGWLNDCWSKRIN
jgi:hypothetical protein